MTARRITVELEQDVADGLAKAADLRGARVEDLAADVVASFVSEDAGSFEEDYSPEDVAAIEEGIAQAERGEVVAQDEMMARLKLKYGG